MREILKERVGKRGEFSATVIRFGWRTSFGYRKETLLVRNVCDESGAEVTDHLWFTVGKQIRELELSEGERIKFCARVAAYQKSYKGRREDDDLPPISTDYCLKFPNQFRRFDESVKPEFVPADFGA